MAFPRIEGYVVTEKIGSGSYSTVYKAYNKVGARETVAVKCVEKSLVKQSGAAVDNLVSEIRLLKSLTHDHIVKMHQFTWDDKNIYIIMEYCSGGDLARYIRRYGRVPETQVRYFLQQLASALKFLYEKGVVHMDLKPHNLLLHKGPGGKLTLKVADFGFAQHLKEAASWSGGVRGSPLYMAPEMVAGAGGATVDLWSVGVIMYECLFGAAPYASSSLAELLEKIHQRREIALPRGASISPGCAALLRSLLQHDPARRISYEEFFSHEYLDLEHMPSPENYEKAVSLIKLAVSLDAAGDFPRAFTAYKDSLRYLVPCVGAERDSVRRAALRAKLTSYMERAEELKLYLSGQTEVNPGTRAGHAGVKVRAGDSAGSLRGQDELVPTRIDPGPGQGPNLGPTGPNTNPGPGASPSLDPDPSVGPNPGPGISVGPNVGPGISVGANVGPGINVEPNVGPGRRFTLRRLFGRQNSLPLLDPADSTLTNNEEIQDKSQKQTEDACRIN